MPPIRIHNVHKQTTEILHMREGKIQLLLCTDQIGHVQHVFIIMGCLLPQTNTQFKWTTSKVQLILILFLFLILSIIFALWIVLVC